MEEFRFKKGKNLDYQGLESKFQKAVAQLLDLQKALWYHVSNESTYNKGGKKAQGVKPGVPDVVICQSYKDKHGLYIELKVKGKSPSDDQLEFMKKLRKNGYGAYWIRGYDEFLELLDYCYG